MNRPSISYDTSSHRIANRPSINNDTSSRRMGDVIIIPRRPMTRSEMQRAVIDTGYRELDRAITLRGRWIVWLKADLWDMPNW